MGDEGARIGAVLRRNADPGVDVAGVLKILNGEHAYERGPDGLGKAFGLRAVSAGKQDKEIVPTGTVEAAFRHKTGNGQAHVLEQEIAFGVAEGFVEQLEIADVEQDDGTVLALAQHVLEVPERGLPVGDVEQGIVVSHVLKPAGVEHALGDVDAADEVDHLIVEPTDFFYGEAGDKSVGRPFR